MEINIPDIFLESLNIFQNCVSNSPSAEMKRTFLCILSFVSSMRSTFQCGEAWAIMKPGKTAVVRSCACPSFQHPKARRGILGPGFCVQMASPMETSFISSPDPFSLLFPTSLSPPPLFCPSLSYPTPSPQRSPMTCFHKPHREWS